MSRRRQVFCCLGTAILLGMNGYAVSNEDTLSRLDGVSVTTQAGTTADGLLLPLREIGETTGCDTVWTPQRRTVMVKRGARTVTLDLEHQAAADAGREVNRGSTSGKELWMEQNAAYLSPALWSLVFAVYPAESDTAVHTATLEMVPVNPITIRNLRKEEKGLYWSAQMQYPQISGSAQDSVVNAAFQKIAQDALEEGRRNERELERLAKDGSLGEAVGETYLNYRIAYNENGLLSVVFSDYQYAGGAHGTTVQTGVTYDLTTGERLSLSALMNGKQHYTAKINMLIRQEINRRIREEELMEFDTNRFETIGDHPAFYLTSEALVFFFQQYAHFPYAAGIQEFPIAYQKVSSLLAKPYTFLARPVEVLKENENNVLQMGQVGEIILPYDKANAWEASVSSPSVLWFAGDAAAGSKEVRRYRPIKPGWTVVTLRNGTACRIYRIRCNG